MTETASETPVLDLLARMTADSVEMLPSTPTPLVRGAIAGLVALSGAPAASYALNLAIAGELELDAEDIRGAPGRRRPDRRDLPRGRAATGRIAVAIGVAIEMAAEEYAEQASSTTTKPSADESDRGDDPGPAAGVISFAVIRPTPGASGDDGLGGDSSRRLQT